MGQLLLLTAKLLLGFTTRKENITHMTHRPLHQTSCFFINSQNSFLHAFFISIPFRKPRGCRFDSFLFEVPFPLPPQTLEAKINRGLMKKLM